MREFLFPWGNTKPLFGTDLDMDDPLVDGLAACYALNAGTGTSLQNLVTGEVTASALPDPTMWQPGRDGWSLKCDGSTDFASLGRPLGVPVTTGDCTLEAWVRVDVKPSLTIGATFWGSDGGGGAGGSLCDLSMTNSGAVRMHLFDGTHNISATDAHGTGYADHLWHHWVGVRQAGTARLYRDGNLQATVSDTTTTLDNVATVWSIGRRPDSGGSTLNGAVSLCRLWHRGLSDSDVQSLYGEPYRMFAPLFQTYYVFGAGGTLWTQSCAETLILTDTRTVLMRQLSTEILSLTDTRAAAFNQGFLSESLSLSDLRTLLIGKELADPLGLTDTRRVDFTQGSLSESLSLSDLVNAALVIVKALSETLSLTDAVTSALVLLVALTESLSLADALDKLANKGLAEPLDLTDERAFDVSHAITEVLSLADDRTMDMTKAPIGEALSLLDTRNVLVEKAVTEVVSLSDDRLMAITKACLDALTLSDARHIDVFKSLAETFTLSDSALGVIIGVIGLLLSSKGALADPATTDADGDTITEGGGIA